VGIVTSYGQADSVEWFSKKVSLGISKNQVDSIFPFFIGKHYKNEEFERQIIDGAIQYRAEYFGMTTGMSYSMKFVFDSTGLIFFGFSNPYVPRTSYELIKRQRVDKLVNDFNKKWVTTCRFLDLYASFETEVFNLDKGLQKFFYSATYEDKARLLFYSKFICPEYRAAAIIRLVELERAKRFLTKEEKSHLRQIAFSEVSIHFINGCIYSFEPLYSFVDMREQLKILEN
jgi:hypothetical protein